MSEYEVAFHNATVTIHEQLAKIAELQSRIARMEKAGDAMAKHPYPMTDSAHIESGTYCVYCHLSYKVEHTPDCPVTEWQEAKK